MKIPKKIILVICLLCFTKIAMSETYTVNSPNFTEVYGVYTTNFNIVGTFTTDQPLVPNSGTLDIKDNVIAYEFYDGVQTINQNNSTVLFFSAQVNEMNQTTGLGITIWRSPITTMQGGNVSGMDIYISPTFSQVVGFLDGICNETNGPGGRCSSAATTDIHSGLYFFYDEIFRNGFEF